MKRWLTVGLCLCMIQLWAQPKLISSKIDKVTVFFSGAQITRSAKLSLPAGRTELVFKELSSQLTKESIQLSMGNSVSIASVVHQQSSQAETGKRDELAVITKQKLEVEEKVKTERSNLKVYQREEEMLLKNQAVGGTATGIKVADLKEAVEFQRIRMQEVLNKQLEIDRTIKKLEDDIRKLNQKLTEASTTKDVSMSEIVVTVTTKEPQNNLDVVLTYFVQNAGWSPIYDAKVSSIEKPISLLYKANVYQYSGEDWKDIRLTLSNANPKRKGTAPDLRTWYWGVENNYSDYYNAVNIKTYGITQVSGTVRDEKEKGYLPGVSIAIKGTSLGVVTDVNGFYRLNIPPDLQNKEIILTISFIGYKAEERKVNTPVMNIELKEDTMMLQEVVVTAYSVSDKSDRLTDTKSLSGKVAGVSVKRSLITEEEAPASQQFELIQPYTILPDGKVYNADLKELEMPAIYEYYCVPKIDPDVFLTAKVLGWDKYSLLPGDVNLFFEGTYLGKSSLDLSNQDTLTLSLGRDKSVLVKRTKLKEFQKKQFVGGSKIDSYSYEISIRNTRKQVISMVVDDQFPLSRYKQVEVYDQEALEAEVNKDSGKLTWRFGLEPSQEKKLRFKYTVKYPKNGTVEVN
ncbi:MAG: mucoidy inhibitor MuiA family protein [Spirosomataceae bacterium]